MSANKALLWTSRTVTGDVSRASFEIRAYDPKAVFYNSWFSIANHSVTPLITGFSFVSFNAYWS